MKQFVSVWNMRKAFTLIEVMVAVVIISVVIMALLQMRGNSSHIFSNLSKKFEINQYISFLISNNDYGFENKITTLNRLMEDFEIDDDLKRELKKVKVDVIYKEIKSIDKDEQNSENENSGIVFDIGETILKTDNSSASLIRLKVK